MHTPKDFLPNQDFAQIFSYQMLQSIAEELQNQNLKTQEIEKIYEELTKFNEIIKNKYQHQFTSHQNLENIIRETLGKNQPSKQVKTLIESVLNSTVKATQEAKSSYEKGIIEIQDGILAQLNEVQKPDFINKVLTPQINKIHETIKNGTQKPLSSKECRPERQRIIQFIENTKNESSKENQAQEIFNKINQEFYLGEPYRSLKEIIDFIENYKKPKLLTDSKSANSKTLTPEEIAAAEQEKETRRALLKEEALAKYKQTEEEKKAIQEEQAKLQKTMEAKKVKLELIKRLGLSILAMIALFAIHKKYKSEKNTQAPPIARQIKKEKINPENQLTNLQPLPEIKVLQNQELKYESLTELTPDELKELKKFIAKETNWIKKFSQSNHQQIQKPEENQKVFEKLHQIISTIINIAPEKIGPRVNNIHQNPKLNKEGIVDALKKIITNYFNPLEIQAGQIIFRESKDEPGLKPVKIEAKDIIEFRDQESTKRYQVVYVLIPEQEQDCLFGIKDKLILVQCKNKQHATNFREETLPYLVAQLDPKLQKELAESPQKEAKEILLNGIYKVARTGNLKPDTIQLIIHAHAVMYGTSPAESEKLLRIKDLKGNPNRMKRIFINVYHTGYKGLTQENPTK
jgi:hypothetical protein